MSKIEDLSHDSVLLEIPATEIPGNFFFKKNFQVFWAPDAQKLGTGDLGTGPPATQEFESKLDLIASERLKNLKNEHAREEKIFEIFERADFIFPANEKNEKIFF